MAHPGKLTNRNCLSIAFKGEGELAQKRCRPTHKVYLSKHRGLVEMPDIIFYSSGQTELSCFTFVGPLYCRRFHTCLLFKSLLRFVNLSNSKQSLVLISY